MMNRTVVKSLIDSNTPWYQDHLPLAQVKKINQERLENAQKVFCPEQEYQEFLVSIAELPKAKTVCFDQAAVKIGSPSEISVTFQSTLVKSLENMKPWKKGPFNIFGTLIDSEWRSDLKWSRLEPYLPSLKNQVIADIGCHNGYFMFRMLPHRPRLVVGFEPVAKHWKTFHFLNTMANQKNLFFETLGIESIHLFPEVFDTIFCLGILYHHTDPVGLLRKMKEALKPEGTLLIDCQGIPGDAPYALVPQNRYAGARGIWFLPTISALQHWVRRAGFQKVQIIYADALSTVEQRTTTWAPIRSLKDFLDPTDPGLTKEGYPAPHRFYLKVQ